MRVTHGSPAHPEVVFIQVPCHLVEVRRDRLDVVALRAPADVAHVCSAREVEVLVRQEENGDRQSQNYLATVSRADVRVQSKR